MKLSFPEGTTSVGASLLPFKKGAFLPGDHLIHPVVLRYPNRVDCTTWTLGNGGTIGLLIRAMASLYNKAEVMPAVSPAGDPLMCGEDIRRAMGEVGRMDFFKGDLRDAESFFG